MTALAPAALVGSSLDDVLQDVSARFGVHLLIEGTGGRVMHHQTAGAAESPVIEAVMTKRIAPLIEAYGRPRTVGLVPGGAVVVRGGHVITVPMRGSSWLWLVEARAGVPALDDVAAAAARVSDALHLDLDSAGDAGQALFDALTQAQPLPGHLLNGCAQWRLIALTAERDAPRALLAKIRRSPASILAATIVDQTVLVAVPDAPLSTLPPMLASLEGEFRCAVSDPLLPAQAPQAAHRQLEACLTLPLHPGEPHRIAHHRSSILLELLRDAVAAAAAQMPDPLDVLDSGDTDFRRTLAVWLDAHGDSNLASQALGIHVNTLRYRLSRIRDLLPCALDQPDVRLALHLRLRLGA
jgi:hypothetical protein